MLLDVFGCWVGELRSDYFVTISKKRKVVFAWFGEARTLSHTGVTFFQMLPLFSAGPGGGGWGGYGGGG